MLQRLYLRGVGHRWGCFQALECPLASDVISFPVQETYGTETVSAAVFPSAAALEYYVNAPPLHGAPASATYCTPFVLSCSALSGLR